MADLRVAVIGAGIIGGTHIATLGRSRGVALCAVVDPTDAGAAQAAEQGVPHYRDVSDLLDAGGADAAVVATPNHTHVPIATVLLQCPSAPPTRRRSRTATACPPSRRGGW